MHSTRARTFFSQGIGKWMLMGCKWNASVRRVTLAAKCPDISHALSGQGTNTKWWCVLPTGLLVTEKKSSVFLSLRSPVLSHKGDLIILKTLFVALLSTTECRL
jgi:hypothetical protein